MKKIKNYAYVVVFSLIVIGLGFLSYKKLTNFYINQEKDYNEWTPELGSKFETDKSVLDDKPNIFSHIKQKEEQIDAEPTVMVNHARKELRQLMIQKGICYIRAGDSKGSILVQTGFERMQYLLLHTGGSEPQLFKLKTKGMFQIWTKETLLKNGFNPQSAPYYIVLHFDSQHPIPIIKMPKLKEDKNTYRAKIKKLSEFV